MIIVISTSSCEKKPVLWLSNVVLLPKQTEEIKDESWSNLMVGVKKKSILDRKEYSNQI